MCYTYVLATYYLYTIYMIPLNTPPIPQGVGVSYMLHYASYNVLLPINYLSSIHRRILTTIKI